MKREMKRDPFDLKDLLSSLNEHEYKDKLKKDICKLEERSIEIWNVERRLFLRIQKEFTMKNGFTRMEYGILKLKIHIYQEEKKSFRNKYKKILEYLQTWDHPKEKYYIMEMDVRKMGRNIQKMKDFQEWVIEMMDTKKIEREMKKMNLIPIVLEKNISEEKMYISSSESEKE